MGGTVALLLAANNPGSVKCVVAVAAPVDRRLQLQYLLQSDDPYLKRLANHLASLGSRLELTSPSRFIGSGMPPVLYIRGSLSPAEAGTGAWALVRNRITPLGK